MPDVAATYEVGTPAGTVRLLSQDTDVADPYFLDTEIDAFLTLEAGDVRLAAAQALDAIASSEALILKKIRQLGGALETDGPAVAKALREHARSLREQVALSAAGVEGDVAGLFDVAEMIVDPFGRHEHLINDALRSQA
ncbi:MAG TPA: hypothetical protein VEW95_09450 [Candidatus Limnocylindrales bacterium]|nr:hypothetical protein [Candidatus Limnocylindrales bacterium]